jgi:hypothetical protein
MNNEQALVAVQPEEGGQLLELQFVDGPAAEPEEEITGDEHPNFIESNTLAISIEELATRCIVPTFSDNSLTIAHQNAIAAVYKAAEDVFGELTPPECRVSHAINGRVASAIHKPAKELTDEEKTIFYQRLAFVAHVKSLTRIVAGQPVELTIGLCRAYNEDKLYSKKSPEKMKIFVGWKVRVCSNLCLTCNGNSGIVEVLTEADVYQKAYQLFRRFDPEKEDTLKLIENLNNTRISESLFCYIIGRLRLYQALPTEQQKSLPSIEIGDQAVNAAVRGFVSNPNFGIKEGESSISMFEMLQLLNEAIKQTYIDKWVDRNQNCTDFALGIQKAIQGNDTEGYNWFLQ